MIPIDEIESSHGKHATREKGVCLMEAVAWWQGEEHSDMPECVCSVIFFASNEGAMADLEACAAEAGA